MAARLRVPGQRRRRAKPASATIWTGKGHPRFPRRLSGRVPALPTPHGAGAQQGLCGHLPGTAHRATPGTAPRLPDRTEVPSSAARTPAKPRCRRWLKKRKGSCGATWRTSGWVGNTHQCGSLGWWWCFMVGRWCFVMWRKTLAPCEKDSGKPEHSCGNLLEGCPNHRRNDGVHIATQRQNCA